MTKRTRNCNSKNHLLVTIFAALLAVLVPQQLAAYNFMVDGLCYNITGGTTVEVTYQNYSQSSYTDLSGDLIIPETVTNNGTTYSVTSIGWNAFRGCSGLTSVTIPNSVTSIGSSAFDGCSGMRSITIPNSVTYIGNGAFGGCCKVESIKVASGNRVYDSRNDCNAIIETGTNTLIFGCKTSSIPNSVTSIGDYAFEGCSGLTSVTIPNSVTSIGGGAFYGCSGLTSVTIPNSVTSIGGGAFSGCSGLTSVTIPNSVTAIGDSVFGGCIGLISVTIPNSVTAIGAGAFNGCSGLLSVSIPKSVKKIGINAFEGCSNLKKVDINDIQAWCQLEFDRREYFEGTSTYAIYEGDSIMSYEIPYYGYDYLSFSANPLYYAQHLYLNGVEVTNLSIPEGTTSISDIAFVNLTALQTVEFPNSLDFVGRHAFQGCKNLNKIYINSLESWSNITYSSFYTYDETNCDCYVYDYGFYWPTIYYTFYDNYANPLRYAHHLYLGNQEVKTVKVNRTNLKYLTFSGGKFFETLVISDSVENIERNAFQDCSGLRFIKCYRNIPPSIDNPWNLPDYIYDYYYNPEGDDDASPFKGCELDSIVLQVPGKYISNYTNSEWSSVFKRISTLEDINIDGNVDIADVNAVLNVMMGQASNISQEDADVNSDGEVDIFDVNQIICVMLGNGTVPEPVPHKTFTVNGVSFTMVAVEGGTFTMGATPEQGSDAWDCEKPAHQVTLSGYSIGQTEVTQALWQAVMGSNSSRFTGDLQRPVERVSWNDCQTFINKLNQLTGQNFRLPTEAEWEYAARGGNRSKGYKYAGSNTIDDMAWYSGNSSSTTHPVATKAPNELGLYDMGGNVLEWCQDWYGSYSSDAQTNPTGPASGSDHVYRGGSWYGHAGYCRVSYRDYGTPSYSYSHLGLRLAL